MKSKRISLSQRRMVKQMKKIKIVGFIVVTVATYVVSLIYGITLTAKNGGLMLLPVLYFLVAYVIPHMVKDYISGWKKIVNDGEVCFTKGEKYRRWFEEAIGKEVERLETSLEGEEVSDSKLQASYRQVKERCNNG